MDMKKIGWIMVFVLMLCSAFAQQTQDGTYRLQPEDVIRIQLYNENNVAADVQVGRDGNITPPFASVMRAEGRTTSEIEADLVLEYQRRLRIRDPRVSVVIVRYRELFASIGGAVLRPGKYTIRPTDNILSLYTNGGGANGIADLRRATLQRANSRELIPVDLYAMLIKGDMSQNYVLEDGDIITIPDNPKASIQVLGAVQRPQQVQYREGITLSEIMAACGGDIPFRSKLSETLVIREREGLPGSYLRINCNYVNFLKRGDASQNIALRPGDIVYIPDTKTPSGGRIGELAGAVANVLFILDRVGINPFKR